jgi:hypothetical protein
MIFNSQICTTKEQSERLLALGLKVETADMHHYKWSEGYWDIQACPVRGSEPCYIPAWSLHRLIELCGIERLPICFGKKGRVRIRVSHIHPTHDGRSGYNHYDSLIDCIEWLIGEGYFNKEYLE